MSVFHIIFLIALLELGKNAFEMIICVKSISVWAKVVDIAHFFLCVTRYSGSFGRGGVFNALRTKSQRIVEVYEMAAKMDDLHIGDAHLIENVTDVPAVDSKQGFKIFSLS